MTGFFIKYMLRFRTQTIRSRFLAGRWNWTVRIVYGDAPFIWRQCLRTGRCCSRLTGRRAIGSFCDNTVCTIVALYGVIGSIGTTIRNRPRSSGQGRSILLWNDSSETMSNPNAIIRESVSYTVMASPPYTGD